MKAFWAVVLLCLSSVPFFGANPPADLKAKVDQLLPQLRAFYIDLHQSPELSLHEENTAAKLAAGLRKLGFEVTEHVGGTGVVGVLKNGDGPVVLIRTELDALPVEEQTGLPYASKVKTKNASGQEVSVMHACGHDLHMASWLGTATLLSQNKSLWHGTLLMIGQPAEEIGAGADAMIKDGLLTRFPKPDYSIAVHDDSAMPAGQVDVTGGPVFAAAASVKITIYGRGGHGAQPQTTVDPIVIAARTILSLQTIVSRELSPLDPAVVTVGAIHGGTKNNIIPDKVEMLLTVRAFKPEVHKHILESITRITKAEAAAAGAPQEPKIEASEALRFTTNDPALAARLASVLTPVLAKNNILTDQRRMVSEDFGAFGNAAGVPSVLMLIGAVPPEKFAEAQKTGDPLPSLHSSQWAPDLEPAMRTAILTEVTSALDLFSGTK
ncbi:Peptidase M20D, amidohydrolase [Candidatus Koribacter versatilis Ellin345]|uniref:Peptidase M20D, amidohydrolase n=1 Tax=Koribacter versatilis (strain Ellin345) TaxID=204669 RepID=Q1IRA1_KORVE|nr:amidohydrolase [Candidatus Koribacter versatilis]ABF40599.1 Peptidase M20D, amidohydrolase [Candidatus Koribacter versatilis Ellin345]